MTISRSEINVCFLLQTPAGVVSGMTCGSWRHFHRLAVMAHWHEVPTLSALIMQCWAINSVQVRILGVAGFFKSIHIYYRYLSLVNTGPVLWYWLWENVLWAVLVWNISILMFCAIHFEKKIVKMFNNFMFYAILSSHVLTINIWSLSENTWSSGRTNWA